MGHPAIRRAAAWGLMLTVATVAAMPRSVSADPLRYADRLVTYEPGPAPEPGYTSPTVALGRPSTGHTPQAPENIDPLTWEPTVVSLGQAGRLTLGFNRPVHNQPTSSRNPYGYDLLLWGNAFQGGNAITPEFEFGRFHEPGFVEVAQTDAAGEPIEWYLILPRIFRDTVICPTACTPARPGLVPRNFSPAELRNAVRGPIGEFLASGDISASACLFDGFADTVPAQGSALQTVLTSGNLDDLVLDDPATFAIEGLGGSGIDLSRAVRQSSPGIPLLEGDQFQFVELAHIDLLRITDAKPADLHPGALGGVTTEVDGVIVLPDLRDCHVPFADADGDGDVDQRDFGLWQACYTGPGGTPAEPLYPPQCVCFDRNRDGNVDGDDFTAFDACAATSGPAIPAAPDCGS